MVYLEKCDLWNRQQELTLVLQHTCCVILDELKTSPCNMDILLGGVLPKLEVTGIKSHQTLSTQ